MQGFLCYIKAMNYKEVVKELESMRNTTNIEGMARFGINPKYALGIRVPNLRKLAKEVGKSHQLALVLWDSGYHEARILASMVDVPAEVTEEQIEQWVGDFNSWDLCDQCCMNLFVYTKFAVSKVFKWAKREEEFQKRAAFAEIACLAWKRKDLSDNQFLEFLPLVKEAAGDNRNFVKKAVNWALRQIGKRNLALNEAAIKCAKEILKQDSKAAKWIAADALKELESDAIQKRLI